MQCSSEHSACVTCEAAFHAALCLRVSNQMNAETSCGSLHLRILHHCLHQLTFPPPLIMKFTARTHADDLLMSLTRSMLRTIIRLSSFLFFFILYFKVRGREPDVAHRTVGACAWPGSTSGHGGQPNLFVLSLPLERDECPSDEKHYPQDRNAGPNQSIIGTVKKEMLLIPNSTCSATTA